MLKMREPVSPLILENENPIEGLKLRVLKVLLLVGTFALVGFWLTELKTGVIGHFDTYAYPLLISCYTLLTTYLFLRPQNRQAVEVVTIFILAVYFVITHWLYFISPETASLGQLSYQQSRIIQWYVLIFIAAFVFFNTKAAILSSAVFYLALAIPEMIFLFDGTPDRAKEVSATAAIALISNPVYIVCLWGVSLIKEQAHKSHGHAEVMAEAASRDALTGALNRRGVFRILEDMADNPETQNESCALILFDLDHFKQINDTKGHDKGDETLVALSELTQAALRSHDRLARWGGEEFLILAPGLSCENAVKLAERLRRDLEKADSAALEGVTASFGISRLIPSESFGQAIKDADEALYKAKAGGRNQVVSANPT